MDSTATMVTFMIFTGATTTRMVQCVAFGRARAFCKFEDFTAAVTKNKEAPALRSVVRKDNRGSLRLHQKFGFQIIRQVERYYGNPPSAAFVLELVLKPAPPA